MPRATARVITQAGGEPRTKQAFKDECDINRIVKRHGEHGLWDHLTPQKPLYGDFSTAVDLQDAIELVQAAEDSFMALPAEVRALADNDPIKFAQMCASRDDFDALVQAGLIPGEGYEPLPDEDGADGDSEGKSSQANGSE